MEMTVEQIWRPTPAITWKVFRQQCANASCAAKYPKLNGLLKSMEGVRVSDRWYCGLRCFEEAMRELFARSIATAPQTRVPFQNRMPLGLLMVQRGLIEHHHVKAALEVQAETGEQLGRCLQRVAPVKASEVAAAVGLQLSCPVYRGAVDPACARLVPRRLQELYGMLPVHYVRAGRDLYVGFRGRVDHTALYAVEQMLGCHTEPCVLEDQGVEAALRTEDESESRDLVVDHASSALEMARFTSSYAQQLRAGEVRVVDCGEYAWARVFGPRHTANLLFRRKARGSEMQ